MGIIFQGIRMTSARPAQPLWMTRTIRWSLAAVMVLLVSLGAAGYYFTTQFQSMAAPNDFGQLEALTLLNDQQLRTKLIRTGDADFHYNCHGWTFTRGQREVDAEE